MLGKCSTIGLYPETFNLLCICMCLFFVLGAGTHRYQKRKKTSMQVIDIFEQADVHAEI